MQDEPQPSDDGQEPDDAVARAIAEHRTVHVLVREILATREADALAERVEALAEFLVGHFEVEEAPDGLYDTIDGHAPHLQRRSEALRAQHVAIKDELGRLLSELRGATAGSMRDRVATLCELILAHEAAENQLHGEAIYTELGGGD